MPEDINIGYPARTNISGKIVRYESQGLERFSYVSTITIPATIQFAVFNTDGSTLAVPTGGNVTVTVSGPSADIGSLGVFYIDRQLPISAGFYTYEWRAYGSSGASSGSIGSSLFIPTRGIFEVAVTEARSFVSYGDKGNVLRVARQLIGRGDLTERDVQPHMEAAYGYINGRLGYVMTVPLSPTPDYIAQGEEVLSLYTMYGTFGGTEKTELPPSFNKLRDDFIEYLGMVVDGTATIEVSSGTLSRREETIEHITGGIEGGTPIFGLRPFEEQSVDTDVLDDEADRDS